MGNFFKRWDGNKSAATSNKAEITIETHNRFFTWRSSRKLGMGYIGICRELDRYIIYLHEYLVDAFSLQKLALLCVSKLTEEL